MDTRERYLEEDEVNGGEQRFSNYQADTGRVPPREYYTDGELLAREEECDCTECIPVDYREAVGNFPAGGDCEGSTVGSCFLCEVNYDEGCDCIEEDEESSDPTPEAPEGYEWVLMPERPGGKSPGENGHYSDRNPEPIQVAEAWGLDANEFNILKYMARWRKKGGIQSLEKIKFYADREIAKARREGLN